MTQNPCEQQGINHRIAPFPCSLQWFNDRKVSVMIIVICLFFIHSYWIKALADSTLMIPTASKGNKTNPNIARTSAWYLSSPKFHSSLSVFSLVSMNFHLNPSLVVLYWSTWSRCNNIAISIVMPSILCMKYTL